MVKEFQTKSNHAYKLVRATKYTKLIYIRKDGKEELVFQWLHEDIERILGGFEAQVKHFEENLK